MIGLQELVLTNFWIVMQLAKAYFVEMMGMPLTMGNIGEPYIIKKIGGKTEIRQFLETLGFVQGSSVTVITQISGNVIVSVKDSRIAISREMASKIMV